jgi:hypothetical protein
MAFLHPARRGRRSRALVRRSLYALALPFFAACGDGGTGPVPVPVPQNPMPAVSSLNPPRLLQWSDSVNVTVTGTGFVGGSVVRLDGIDRPTTYVSATQLTTWIPVARMQDAGMLQLKVFNPAPGGGESAPTGLPVEHRVPDLLFLEPAGALQGSEALTLAVNGMGFTQSSVVRWNGIPRPTTFVNQGRVTAQIPASDLAQVGMAQITVFSPAPGGGMSGTRIFAVSVRPNPAPQLTSVSPNPILAGTGATFMVTGTGFVPGAQVTAGGFSPATTVLSSTQLTFTLQGSNVPNAGFAQVLVTNPAPGGGASNAIELRIDNPEPVLAALTPAQAAFGADSLVVRLTGTGFVAGTVVEVDRAPVATQRIGPTELRIVLDAEDVGDVASYAVRAVNPGPGGGASAELTLSIVNPVPAVQTISPAQVGAGLDSLVVRVTGTGFVPGAVARFEGEVRPTTRVSATELDVVLSGTDLDDAGTFGISVLGPQPGGGGSNTVSLVVANPVPTLVSASPAQGLVGLDSLVVRLTGTAFVRNTVVRLNDAPRTTRYVSPTAVDVVLEANDLDQPTTYTLRAFNAQPGGGASNPLAYTLVNPAPVLQSVSPPQATAGLDSLVVQVTGTGFVMGTVVRFEGAVRPTRRISGTRMEAVLRAVDLDSAGTFDLTASTPAPGGGTSAPVPLVLAAPVPVLNTLPSSGASAGRPGFPLVVHGSGFLRGSVVQWNGQPRPTQYVSGTRLEATISSADVAAPGAVAVTVHTPGGGTSATRQITIRTPGSTAVTSTRTLALPIADMVYDDGRNRIYASIPNTPGAGARANTVVAIDPGTGNITGQVLAGSNPAALALSEDGSTLWVALNGSGSVRRLSLPDLTPGLTFSLDGQAVEEMKAMPGRPGSVAISLRNTCCSPRHEGVAVYDNGVRRSRVTEDHTGSNSIAFGESASVLYGYNNETTEFGFRTMSVGADGVTTLHTVRNLIDGFSQRIQFARGRVYSTGGDVLDAARRERVGAFATGGNDMAVDPVLGRIFFTASFSGQVSVYDLNTFQSLGTVNAGATGRLLRWGSNGLAIADETSLIIIRTPIAGP